MARPDPALPLTGIYDSLPSTHRSPQAQADLAVLRSTDAPVRSRILLINHAHNIIKAFGSRLPSCSANSFAHKAALYIPDPLRPALAPILETIASLTKQIRVYDQKVENLCSQRYPETKLLRPVSGVCTRIILLFSIAWLTRLTTPLFTIFDYVVTGRGIILIVGGLFLLGKSTREIHDKLEGEGEHVTATAAASITRVVFQIMLLDIVFSLDSVITAVGMANRVEVMVAAIVIAVVVMLFASGPISKFVNQHPTLKILALSFLLMIGVSLVAEGWNSTYRRDISTSQWPSRFSWSC